MAAFQLERGMLAPIVAPDLAGLAGISHGFYTRHGGVSQGVYASLNCGLGSKDDAAAVHTNRARVAAQLGAAHLITAHQVHSATAVAVREAWSQDARPRADAIVTATPGIALGVLSADCAPVLFADPQARVVGAAHAGWRGAISGILEATIAGMEGLGASRGRICATLGPCIGPAAYEVGWDFQRELTARDSGSGRYFAEPAAGARPHFDLPGYVLYRLERAGLGTVSCSTSCTYAHDDIFFSYRRARANQAVDYGRQISAIVLT